MKPKPPRLIGDRYAPIRPLGAGGYGTVYVATDARTQRRVALKFLTGESPDAPERFRREARILDALAGADFVVQILDHDLDHAPPFLVMELCDGGSLREWVRQRRPWRQVAAALSHALLGLSQVHQAGGFHRDLKPDNLLLAAHPTVPGSLVVKVGDWGLARTPGTQGPMTHGYGGTPGYIAPEVVLGAPFTAAADIYSLGVVACELLTGDITGALLEAAAMPAEFRTLVRRMLAREPSHRPLAMQMAQTLGMLVEGPEAVAAPPPADDGPGVGAFILGGLLFAGAVAALAALADGADVPKAPGG